MTDNEIPDYAAQAPARRFGAVVGIIATLIGCACLFGIWAFFGRESIKTLQTSVQLQSEGVRITGAVVEVEHHEGVKPNSSGTYTLFVGFEVDGQRYTVRSLTTYPVRDSSWVGEPMPVIYDPQNPQTAQIDTFNERWFTPILAVQPF